MTNSLMEKYSINKEGYITIGVSVLLTVLFFLFSSTLGVFGFFCTLLFLYFFRDPKRVIPLNKNFILSPADGTVCKIENALPPKTMELEDEMIKISIFLSPLNVHVNRIPIDGKITKLHYQSGKCLRADYDSSEGENERQEALIEANIDDQVKNIVVVQQTGFLTRRIVCDLNADDEVRAGKRFGIIKFGSRVTVFLPREANLFIKEGQTVIGGETIIASFSKHLPATEDYCVE